MNKKILLFALIFILGLMSVNAYNYNYSYPNLCYQESANVSNQDGNDGNCGLNYNGNYNILGIWSNPTLAIDGNYSSYSETNDTDGNTGILVIRYKKPIYTNNNTIWSIKSYFGSINLTINNTCWNYNNENITFYVQSFKLNSTKSVNSWFCQYNYSDYSTTLNLSLLSSTNGDSNYKKIYEESIYWNISKSINYSLSSVDGVFGEYSDVVLNLSKDVSQSYSGVSLTYNGVVYSYPAVFDYGSYVLYDVYKLNNVKGNVSYYWNVSLIDYGSSFNFITVNGSQNIIGLVVNVTFFDVNGSLLNGVPVSLNLIGNGLNSNYSVSSGNVSISNLSSGTYVLIVNAPNYNQNSYVFTVSSSSNIPISVYLQPNASTYFVTITVRNKFDKSIYDNAKVTIQRYVGNSWVTEQIYNTDFNGQCQGYFVLNTVYYNFVVEVNGIAYFGSLNSDVNRKNIFYNDYLNGIIIEIDTSQSSYSHYVSALGVSLNLSFVNTSSSAGYFLYKWYDGGGVTRNGSLHVYNGLSEVSCSNSYVLSSSSSVVCYVNSTSRTYFTAIGLIDGYMLANANGWLGTLTELSFNWGVMGYLISFLLVVISAFAFAKVPSLSIMFMTFVFGLCAIVNFIFNNSVAMGIFVGLGAISFLLAKIPSRSGMNSG